MLFLLGLFVGLVLAPSTLIGVVAWLSCGALLLVFIGLARLGYELDSQYRPSAHGRVGGAVLDCE